MERKAFRLVDAVQECWSGTRTGQAEHSGVGVDLVDQFLHATFEIIISYVEALIFFSVHGRKRIGMCDA